MTEVNEVSEDPKRKGSWLLEHGFIILHAASVLVLLTVYISGNVHRSEQASSDLVTVNLRLDRLFDKLDQITGALPVLSEKLRSAEAQITDGRGTYATLDVRLRAIEANEAANHADVNAIKANPRHLQP